MNGIRNILLPVIVLMGVSCTGETDYLVTIRTDYGEMKAVLYDKTPKHKENFIALARDGFYDSLLWHRVIEGFMIQGGDDLSKNAQPGEELGAGGKSETIPAEIGPDLYHKKGALGAARQPDNSNPARESSGSQFYIVQGQKFTDEELDAIEDNIDFRTIQPLLWQILNRTSLKELRDSLAALNQRRSNDSLQQLVLQSRNIVEDEFGEQPEKELTPEERELYKTKGGAPHLDSAYTVFGEVVDGLDVIDKIASVPTDENNRPVEDVRMWIDVEEVPKQEITAKYGYEYPVREEGE